MAFIDFRGVGSITDLLSFGNVGEVPYTNAAGDDFDYSSNINVLSDRFYLGSTTYSANTSLLNLDAQSAECLVFGNIAYPFVFRDFGGVGRTPLGFNTLTNDVILNAPGSSNFIFLAAGTNEIARFTSSRQLLIGDTSGIGRFNVRGADNTTGVNALFRSLDTTERVKILNNGFVSINQASRTNNEFLSIKSFGTNTEVFKTENSAGVIAFSIYEQSGGNSRVNFYNSAGGTPVIQLDSVAGSYFNSGGFRVGTTASLASTFAVQGTSGTSNVIRAINNTSANLFIVRANGQVAMPNLPTSSAGLSAGDLWNDAGTLKIA